MNSAQFHCPHCQNVFQADASWAGQQVRCPTCQGTVSLPAIGGGTATAPPAPVIPPPPPPAFAQQPALTQQPQIQPRQPMSAGPPPPAPQPIPPPSELAAATRLSCPLCGNIFQVTSDMAGRQVSCPTCQGRVMIPSGGAATTPWRPAESRAPAAPQATVAARVQEPSMPDARQMSHLYPPGMSPAERAQTSAEEQTVPEAPLQEPPPHDPSRYPPGHQAPRKTQEQPLAAPTPLPAREQLAATDQAPTSPTSPTPPTPASPAEAASPVSPREIERQPNPSSVASLPAFDSVAEPRPSAISPGVHVDDLLPPDAADSAASSALAGTMLPPAALPLAALPPAANRREAQAPGPQVPLPLPATRSPEPSTPDRHQAVRIPTEDGQLVPLKEPVKTVGWGDDERELRPLSPEEKSRKRLIKNVVLWTLCLLVLGIVVAILRLLGPL